MKYFICFKWSSGFKGLIITGFLFLTAANVHAQRENKIDRYDIYRSKFLIGIPAGLNYSGITRLRQTFIPEDEFSGYTPSAPGSLGFTGGVLLNYRKNFVGIEAEINYAQQKGVFKMDNHEKNFYYMVKLNYTYLNYNILFKKYLVFGTGNAANRTSVGVGFNAGQYLKPQNNIGYQSGGPGVQEIWGTDTEQAAELQKVLKAKANLSAIVNVAYESPFIKSDGTKNAFPFMIDVRILYGLADVFKTLPSAYNFSEKCNTNNVIQVRLIYCFANI